MKAASANLSWRARRQVLSVSGCKRFAFSSISSPRCFLLVTALKRFNYFGPSLNLSAIFK